MTTAATEGSLQNRMVQDTLRWLERAVIGLNLCPFAKAVYVKGQVHCTVSQATNLEALRLYNYDVAAKKKRV